jgi:hypothetical protein
MRRLIIMVVALGIAGAAAASGVGAPPGISDPLVLHFSGVPGLVPPTAACPEGTVIITGAAAGSNQPARAQLCVLGSRSLTVARERGRSSRDPVPNGTILSSLATIELQGTEGSFTAIVEIRELLEGNVAHRTISGRILGGTATFAGAAGTVQGGGSIVFGSGPPQPDLTLTFDFA